MIDSLNYPNAPEEYQRVTFWKMCKSFSSLDCRNPFEIKAVLDSHEWVSMSSDRTPVGMISRFACSKCGDEYVVMLTSPSAMQAEEKVHTSLEVSANNIII